MVGLLSRGGLIYVYSMNVVVLQENNSAIQRLIYTDRGL